MKSVIQEFCETFADHEEKKVKVWGEPRGWDAQPDSDPWFDVVKAYSWEFKWIAIIEAPKGYRTEKHETRQEVKNAIFKGERADLPAVMFSVGATGFEPATPWSQTKCATNCATPLSE